MYKLLISFLIILFIVYYLLIILQLLKIIQFTNGKIKSKYLLIPFYYFFKMNK